MSGAPDLRRWPEPERRAPARSQPTWAVRAPLAEWLQREARRAADELGSYSVLDVGCGAKPYYPFFAPYASSYVGVDRQNPAAELEGTAEDVPAEDGTFDLVLCTQVLEHVDDPAAAAVFTTLQNARSPRLREPGHTSLHANYHVVAEVPR